MNTLLILAGAGFLAAATTFVSNWLALSPWRRNQGKHWSEQARLVFPVTVAARSNLWTIPAIVTLTVVMWRPDSTLFWLFAGIISVLGVYAGTLPMDLEVYPRIPLRELLRQAGLGILLRFLMWFAFIGAIVLMPDDFNQVSLSIGGLVMGLWIVWYHGGSMWVLQKLGLIAKSPERLQKIAAGMSAKMNVPFRQVSLMRSPIAQAYAVPATNQLLFTERLLELLSDEELASICSHELAHLTETRTARQARFLRSMTFLPWIFFKPLLHQFGLLAFFGLLIFTVAVPRIFAKLSRKLESRADHAARTNEGDAGTYASALAKLYQDSFLPAVTAKNPSTHPHLYDRMLAAGVTPDFPRPAPAAIMAWNGHLFAAIVGILFTAFVMSHFAQWLDMSR